MGHRYPRKSSRGPGPRLPHEGGNNCSGETNLPLCLAALLVPHTASPGRVAIRQERPELFAVAESLAFAIADTLNKPGQFPAALHTAPVYPNDVAVQDLAFSRQPARSSPKYPLAGYGSHTDSANLLLVADHQIQLLLRRITAASRRYAVTSVTALMAFPSPTRCRPRTPGPLRRQS